jgi:hypothetical protein
VRSYTGADLLARIRNLSDTEGQTTRHPDANIYVHIAASAQALRELVSRAGHGYYLSEVSLTTTAHASDLVTGPYTGSSYIGRIYAVTATVNGEPLSLYELPIERIDAWGTQEGPPVAFRCLLRPSDSKEAIRLYPTPDAAYTVKVLHLPPGASTVGASDTIDGFFGWDDWVCWDVAVKLAVRDGRDEDAAAYRAERAEAESRIRADAGNRVRTAHPMTRQDTRRRKQRAEEYSRLTWLRRP